MASGDAEDLALRGEPVGYGAGWPVARRRRGRACRRSAGAASTGRWTDLALRTCL